MARKQGSVKQKSLSVSKARFAARKVKVWSIAYRPGPHSKSLSVPLGFALRELLGLSKNSKETRFLLNSGKVLVDGRARNSRNFPIGLFDIIELEGLKKAFRAVIDTKGRIRLAELKSKERTKLCRIEGKKAAKGKRVLLSTNDGRNFLENSTSLKPGDSVIVQLPEQKIIKEMPLEKGSLVLLLSRKHTGKTASIISIMPGSMRKEPLLTLKQNGKEFQTVARNVFVIGKEKPETELL